MRVPVFIITLIAETLTTLVVAISILVPQQRIWPPDKGKTWGKPVMLILFNIAAVGVILLGILDWNSSIIPIWARIAIGLSLWLIGNILAAWAVVSLGLARTSGEANTLIRRGPYRFSRNPQYLGFMLGLAGWALHTNSVLTMIASMAAFLPLILAPFAEEPWLQARYGQAFDEYRRSVPRFLLFNVYMVDRWHN